MSVASDFMKSKPIEFTDPNTKHDRVLVVGYKKFYVVSGILSMWSDYFAQLFEGKFKEAGKKQIKLMEVDPKAFEEVLNILYDSKFASFEDDLLIPLIDLSYYFMAPKVLDACKSYVDNSLKSLNGEILVQLLDKACEMGINDMKAKIIVQIKNDTSTINCYHQSVVDCANNNNLVSLKTWIGNYLVGTVSILTCPFWLKYSATNKLPSLKAGIVNKILTWDQYSVQNSYQKPLIAGEKLIELVECAFEHNIDALKTMLRKRIFHMIDSNSKTFYDSAYGDTRTVNVNLFLKNNLAKILTLPKEIHDFIVTSTVNDV